VKSLNPEIRRWCTPPNARTYRIKLPQSVADRFLASYNQPTFSKDTRFRQYYVKRGDSFYGLSRRFRVEPAVIRELNGLDRAARCGPGRCS